MIDVYLLSMLLFFGFLALIIFIDRKNVEFKYLVVLRRTKRGLELLDKMAKPKTFWKIVGTIAIIVCVLLAFEGIYSLLEASRLILLGKIKTGLGGVVLPIPSSQPLLGPGYVLIPFWFWIIIIPTILFPHEIAHGIMSRVERIKVKSAGFILFLIFPGAFVEPEEERLKKAKLASKLRIFAMGSFANFLVASLLFTPFLQVGLIPNFIWPSLTPGYIRLIDVNSTSPAWEAGLRPGMLITEINNSKVQISYSDYLTGNYLARYFNGIKPGDEIEIKANHTSYKVRVGERREGNMTLPYIGILSTIALNCDERTFSFVFGLFTWMWTLNLAVAIFNILPIYPLDGGLMLQAILQKINKKRANQITLAVSIITLGLVIFTIFGPSILQELRSFLSRSF